MKRDGLVVDMHKVDSHWWGSGYPPRRCLGLGCLPRGFLASESCEDLLELTPILRRQTCKERMMNCVCRIRVREEKPSCE